MTTTQLFFSFHGRIGLQTFWLKVTLPLLVIGIIVSEILGRSEAEGAAVLMLFVSLLLFWSILAIRAKRWHDLGKSAWWILISLIPVVGGIWALVETGFREGTFGPNRYGPERVGSG